MEGHTLTVLLYKMSREERYELEDYLNEKFDETRIGNWVGSGGLIDNSEQDIAFEIDDPAEAFRLVKQWLKEYGVPKDTVVYINSDETFPVYEDD